MRYLVLTLALTLAGCAANHDVTPLATSGAPRAAGPYAQGIAVDGMIYTAGQVARDPATNALVTGDITVQANRIFDNLKAVLHEAGASFDDVVKVTVYMTNLDDFSKFNDVMAQRFGGHKPARTTVGVARLPSGAELEVDMVARAPK
jgi:2-iminobutanoate/2-iminopropanoate deaminase